MMPLMICQKCVYKLELFYGFQEFTRNTDHMLRRYLECAKRITKEELVRYDFFSFIFILGYQDVESNALDVKIEFKA